MSLPNEDLRVNAIRSWLENELHLQADSIEPASNDASFRRYFRVSHPMGHYVIMDAPPEHEDVRPFIEVAGLLAKSGIHVPNILQKNLEQGKKDNLETRKAKGSMKL